MAIGGIHQQPGTQQIGVQENRGVDQVQGQFNDHQVEVGEAQPRATSALKTAWMEVKHFFTSLFGVRVSTSDVGEIRNRDDAAKSVLHEMTRSNPSELLILNSLGKLLEQAPPGVDDERRQGFDQSMHELFGGHLDGLSDMQLFRLHKNLERNPALLGNLPGLGQGLLMEMAEDDPQALMVGAGKINDMGGALKALYEEVVSKLSDRGYKMGEIDTVMTQPSRTMDLVARKTIENGGDVGAAVLDTYRQIEQEKQGQRMDALRQIRPGDFDGEVRVDDHHEVAQHDNPLAEQGRVALEDARIGLIAPGGQGHCDPGALLSFVSDHFDVCSSPEFWSHGNARMNAENFGSALSLSVLQRIQEQGEVRPKDLEDLQRVLGPYVGIGASPVDPIDPTLAGPLTGETLSTLSGLVFDRYFGEGAEFPLNMQGSGHEREVRSVFSNPEQGGPQRLQALLNAFTETLATQYFVPDNLTGPIGELL